jgi:hypothetical protein
MINAADYMTEKEVSVRLKIPYSTLRFWRKYRYPTGQKVKLKSYKFGTRIRYKITDVEAYELACAAWQEQCAVNPDAEQVPPTPHKGRARAAKPAPKTLRRRRAPKAEQSATAD